MKFRINVLWIGLLLAPLHGRAANLMWNAATTQDGGANWAIGANPSWQDRGNRKAGSLPSLSTLPFAGIEPLSVMGIGFFASSSSSPRPAGSPSEDRSVTFHANTYSGIATISAGSLLITGTLAAAPDVESLGVVELPFGTPSSATDPGAKATLTNPLNAPSGTLDITDSGTLTLAQLASGMQGMGTQPTLLSHRGGWMNTELLALLGVARNDGNVITLDADPSLFEMLELPGPGNRTSDQAITVNFGQITVVPEPATLLLAALGVSALLRRTRPRGLAECNAGIAG